MISDWEEVTRAVPFRFDMETEALGVLANKTNNYEPRMDLAFYDDGGMWIGDMVIKLNKWTYEIGNCGLTGNLFAAMDNWEIDQVWIFNIYRHANTKRRITGTCNDDMALDIVISELACAEMGWEWDLDIANVAFPITGKAADFYEHRARDEEPGNFNNCTCKRFIGCRSPFSLR